MSGRARVEFQALHTLLTLAPLTSARAHVLHRFGLRNSDKVTTKEAHWNRDAAFVNRPDSNKKLPAAIASAAVAPPAKTVAGVNVSPPPPVPLAAPFGIPAPDATPAFGAIFGAPAAGGAGLFGAPAAGGAAPAFPGLFNMSATGQFPWS